MSQKLTLVALALLLTATACLVPRRGGGPVSVVTSIGVLADFVGQVGGQRVQVQALLPPGVDPHTFEPTPRNAQTIRSAGLVVLNGAGLEPRALEALVENNKRAAAPTIALADALGPSLIEEPGQGDAEHGGANPHCWLDPRLAQRYVEQIRDALVRADPAGAEAYRANAERYLAELGQLDRDVAARIETIPPARRKLVTYHDAYAYMARRYGLEQVGFVLRNPGREPSAGELAELVARLRSAGVRTVYSEPQLNARILEVAARDAGVAVDVLYSDAFDDRVTNYADMMRFNADRLVEGLK